MTLLVALVELRWHHLTSRATGRIALLSRDLHSQPARHLLCAGDVNGYVRL